ncbi:MAG: Bax inhibitor-1 family protein [Lawsonibacter sp.]
MSFNPNEFDRSFAPEGQLETLGQYTAKTFLWMVLGLMVTFGVAMVCWMTNATVWALTNIPYVHMIVLVATLFLSFTMASRIERMTVGTAKGMFLAFSTLFGFTMSIYLLIFQLGSLIFVFLATAVYFGALAGYGYLTHRDLSGLRPILMFGLIFLILFGIITMFIPTFTMLDQAACLIGVAIFLGFTAYDTQKIKAYYQYYAGYPDMLAKASVFAALQLYLDFLNLFLYLLRFLGNRRN